MSEFLVVLIALYTTVKKALDLLVEVTGEQAYIDLNYLVPATYLEDSPLVVFIQKTGSERVALRGADPVKAEVKARGDGAGFKTLLRWLGSKDALVLIQDRTMPLVVVRFDVWLEIARRSALLRDPDGDRDRDERRRSAEQGPLPPTDAIAREAA